jgi:hypothetical protein
LFSFVFIFRFGLFQLRILKLNASLCKQIDSGIPIPSCDEREISLRANAVWACELIMSKMNSKLNGIDLDFYLWTMGKDERFRNVERHSTINTIFY